MAKILVVDDSPTEVHVLSKILEKNGYSVITASDGTEGVEKAIAENPDLILMDVVMPGLNGFQATRKISRNESTKDIPVVVVTTKDQETDKEWAKRQGAVGYLVKPVKEKDLIDEIKLNLAG
jgi:twitching motility two-component system response regulator PilH